jgi:hypothetical protein
VVNAFSLDGKVIAPVKGATPNTTGINETQYTGAVAWQTADGTAHTGAFTPSTVYKAVVTLAPKTGWTFEGVVANSFTYSGATSTANTAGSGIVTITFPATAAAGDPDPVNAFVLDGKVTASVAGAIPVTTAINETQYTGTVAWQTADGTAHTNAFAASTVYKAVLTLAAKTGWTFAGVAANSFTYTGATATNAANSGIVTITFPVTAADEPDPNTDIPIGGNPSVKLYLDGSSTALAHNGSTTVGSAGTGTYTVSVDSGYSSVVWYLNGTAQTQFTGGTIILSKRAAGNYLVTVEAVSSNGTKNSGAHTFVVK